VTIFNIAYDTSIFTFRRESFLDCIYSLLIINAASCENWSYFLYMCGKQAQLLYPTEQAILLLDHWTTTVITSLVAWSPAEYIISAYNTPFRSPTD